MSAARIHRLSGQRRGTLPKLSRHAFTRFWDAHAWAGVIGGLVLHVMFVAGAVTLFREQIAVWEEPLAQVPAPTCDIDRALAKVDPSIIQNSRRAWIYPPTDALGLVKIGSYLPEKKQEFRQWWVDTNAGSVTEEREALAEFVFGLHYLWHDLTGKPLYYTAGALAVALLLAIVTGVLLQLKDFARQFHQFRPSRGRRVLWSDLHKVLGVMGLPFQLAYAYTGALIILGPIFVAALSRPVLGGDARRGEAALQGQLEPRFDEPGPLALGLSMSALAQRVRIAEPRLIPDLYVLAHHGHENGTFSARGRFSGSPFGFAEVTLRERDGQVVFSLSPAAETAGTAAYRWVLGLHYVRFGGISVRLLWTFLALATCATILTGNWVFLARRAARGETRGGRLLARLTLGVGAGVFVALAALFLASRLLPLAWSARRGLEQIVFLLVLLGCIAWAQRTKIERGAWSKLLGLAALLLLPVPVLAARWSHAGLFGAGERLAPVVGVDAAILVVALLLGVAALALRPRKRRDSTRIAAQVVLEDGGARHV